MHNHYQLLNNCTVMLAVTYDCQCKCPHCGAEKLKQEVQKKLSKTEIIKIINDCAALGAKSIYFFGGEPLLEPNIFEYITASKCAGLLTRLDTNGILADEKIILKLKGSGLDLIRFSLDSPHEQIHDRLRGIKGSFQKSIKGLQLCQKHNIEKWISSYATKKTLENGDIAKIITIGKSFDAKIRLLAPICAGKWEKREDLILDQEGIDLLRGLLEKNTVFWERIDDKNAPFSCRFLYNELIYISAHGDIQPCCYWPQKFGNIRDRSVDKIIEHMRASEIYIKKYSACDCPVNSLETLK